MKLKIIALAILFFLSVPVLTFAQKGRGRSSGGSVSVKGYTRKDGTHVSGHTRSSPGSRSGYSGSSSGTYNSSSNSSTELEGDPITPHADDSWIYEGVKTNPMNNPNYSKKKTTLNKEVIAEPETISIEEQERLLKGTNSTPPKTENKVDTTPKKKVLETEDIEAYGLAPEVKAEATSSYGSNSKYYGSRSGSVSVKGHTRSNGTYVPSHTRSARSRGGRR
jgi:hypothetical protein